MLSRASCCHTACAYSQSAHHHSMFPGLSQQNPSPIENVRASAHVLFSSTVTRHPPSSQVNQRFQRSSPCRPQTQLMFLPPLKPVSCRWAGTTVATTNFGFRVASVRDAAAAAQLLRASCIYSLCVHGLRLMAQMLCAKQSRGHALTPGKYFSAALLFNASLVSSRKPAISPSHPHNFHTLRVPHAVL